MPLLLEIVQGIGAVDAMLLEEVVQGVSGRESKQPAQLRMSEVAETKFVDRERFQHTAWQITCCAKAAREIVGNLNDHVHIEILRARMRQVKIAATGAGFCPNVAFPQAGE